MPVKLGHSNLLPGKNMNTTIISSIEKQYHRYTWSDAPSWWNPEGEEIAWAENQLTKERHYIKAIEDVPDGWGVVLNYGGRVIPITDLKCV